MNNIRFKESISIKANIEQVFDCTQDYKNRLAWDSFLISAKLTDGALSAGKGVKAYCVAKNKIGMETEYITFNRPVATAVTMTKGPYMFENFSASWTFKSLSEKETEVIFIYSFRLRFPFNLFSHFIKRNLQGNVQRRMTALKNYIEHNKN